MVMALDKLQGLTLAHSHHPHRQHRQPRQPRQHGAENRAANLESLPMSPTSIFLSINTSSNTRKLVFSSLSERGLSCPWACLSQYGAMKSPPTALWTQSTTRTSPTVGILLPQNQAAGLVVISCKNLRGACLPKIKLKNVGTTPSE